ncbi:MAG: PD40 domain-containing protein [Candidatus Marinimicrobia bacterium]|nr:PD40 domain-containing protein [Candidatus Neomarinimicrobiota bacterium]
MIGGSLLLAAGCSENEPLEEGLAIVGLGALLVAEETNIAGNDFLGGDLAWSQDSEEVLYSGGTYGDEGRWIRRMDIIVREAIEVGGLENIFDVQAAPNGDFLVVMGTSGGASGLYLATPPQYSGLSHIDSTLGVPAPMAWSADATLLAFVSGQSGTYGADLQTGLALRNIPANSAILTLQVPGEAFPLAFSPGAGRLLIGERRYDPNVGASDALYLFSYDVAAQTTQFLESLPYLPFRMMRAHWDSAGIRLVYWPGPLKNDLVVYSLETGNTLVVSSEGEENGFTLAAVSPDFRSAALWYREATYAGNNLFDFTYRYHLFVVDLETGEAELIANSGNLSTSAGGVAFSPDGQNIAYFYVSDLSAGNLMNLYHQGL